MNSWSPERVQALKAMVADGLSFGIIADKLGVSRNAVIGKADRLGLKRPKPPTMTKHKTFWTPDNVARLKELVALGWGNIAIGKALGVSPAVVNNRKRILGLTRPYERRITKPKPVQLRLFDLPPEDLTDCSAPLLALRQDQCRWFVQGGGIEGLCCARRVLAGSSYCDRHHHRVYKPGSHRRLRTRGVMLPTVNARSGAWVSRTWGSK